jgi:hypothetical protein
VFATKAALPLAIAVFTLPSDQVLFGTTCPLVTLKDAPLGASPFLNPTPTVNGNVPVSGDVSWKEVMVLPGGGGGGATFDTVTVTVTLVVELPAASFAIARNVCDPLLAVVVSQEVVYGEAVSKVPRLPASSWNCTLATPTLSLALAVTETVPLIVAPFAGALIDTVGGVVSGVPLLTVTVTVALVVLLPAASLAIARSVCEPLLDVVVFHEAEYGEVISRPPRLAPSNWNCTLATPTLSLALAVTETVPLAVAPFAGALIDTVGGVVSGVLLLTVTVTAVLVVPLPAASLAIARNVCEPLLDVVVFQETEYGEAVSRAPRLAPSNWNCTLATPTLSLAFAVTEIVPLTVAPFAGALIDTVGGVVSVVLLLTVTVTVALVVLLPAASLAIARSVCEPLLDVVVFHETEYGEAVLRLPKLAPSSWNCTLATPTLSLAFAVTETVPLTVAPFPGALIDTVGGVVSGFVLLTLTATCALVAELPAASLATAVRI